MGVQASMILPTRLYLALVWDQTSRDPANHDGFWRTQVVHRPHMAKRLPIMADRHAARQMSTRYGSDLHSIGYELVQG
jgi:hypothetical protein